MIGAAPAAGAAAAVAVPVQPPLLPTTDVGRGSLGVPDEVLGTRGGAAQYVNGVGAATVERSRSWICDVCGCTYFFLHPPQSLPLLLLLLLLSSLL